ncbi:amidohydrolase family protein [Variovorax sp. CY25R-8]|jgi:predicted TIM-barrel fold metal-dependent hydrolase|uniref:amidohydrolase family protein n=1 Tax=Variovorax sp. CY25R-8 TaxID=2855501 RepID=UPI0021BA6CDE|nr:amidohydrolase family protein [Variovorax sp. CY25R-8]MCT8174090.1 amidohydrolase family protein [Variovorax sp. CY25R-8]
MHAGSIVPNSAGTRRPRTSAPALACDAHMHVYDGRFAAVAVPRAMVDDATADDYRLLRARTGTQRTVVVQPRAHGTDNATTLAAIRALGPDRTRGVAVLAPEATDAELERLHAGGIRGIRFSLHTATHAATRFDAVETLAHRVVGLGWHLQLHWTAEQVVAHADLLRRLPCTLVFDHLGRLPLPAGTAHPAFAVLRGLCAGGRAWIKLSGAYLDSTVGAAGGYRDTDAVAQAWLAERPDRLVWGSDWPHPTEAPAKPDDADLFDLLARWVPDEAARHRVLVANPAALYDFPTTDSDETTP